jgi:hypothetical protein
MRVFVSWSQDTSRSLAEVLAKWFRNITHRKIDPFCSMHDIEPGERWTRRLANELEATDFGILCLTRDNMDAPWVHFEAGCLSKHIGLARVCPLLFGINPTDLRGPLSQFQAIQFGREEIKQLLDSFNGALGDKGLEQEILDANFTVWWPKLERDVETVLASVSGHEQSMIRTERDLLEEVLSLTRSFVRSPGSAMPMADLTPLGVLRIHRQRPSTDYLQTLIQEAEGDATIRLLGICMMGFTNAPMQAVLGQKLREGCVVRFLTLGADSSFVAQRAIEEKREVQDICNDVALSNKIHRNFIVQRVPEDLRGNIELRHYDAPPNCFLVGTDSRMLVSFYLRGQRGEFLPHLELAVTRGGIYSAFEGHFDAIWDMSKKYVESDKE